jgi:tellurite resistance protein TerC
MSDEVYLWSGFILVVLVMLVLDLGVFHRAARAVRLREAAAWTTLWVTVAMLFALVVQGYDRVVKQREPGAVVEVTAPLQGQQPAEVTEVHVLDSQEVYPTTPLLTLRTADGPLTISAADVSPPQALLRVEKLPKKGQTVAAGDTLVRLKQLDRMLLFIFGYLLEWSLSMDNVFVFAVIFGYFAVPAHLQHRVLFWGILGAVVMRLTFILVGGWLLQQFHWLIYPMGAFLVFTGLKLMWDREKESDLGHNRVLRLARWLMPVTRGYVGQRFFVRMTKEEAASGVAQEGVAQQEAPASPQAEAAEATPSPGRRWLYATPLFLVLLVVETTDVAFAVDSIPAIFGITTNTFVVFSSNVFAILGLRSLYFLLAGTMAIFRYLSIGLATILCFIGVKMLLPLANPLAEWFGAAPPNWKIPTGISLIVVCAILLLAVSASLLHARPAAKAPSGEGP